jgi:5-methylcytosine-specific restriction endonuclease McrA
MFAKTALLATLISPPVTDMRGANTVSLLGTYDSALTPRIRELIWKRDHNTCQRCGLVSRYHGASGQLSEGWAPFLVIHHVDRNRRNNRLENLKLVCPSCHVKEHGREWGNTGKKTPLASS